MREKKKILFIAGGLLAVALCSVMMAAFLDLREKHQPIPIGGTDSVEQLSFVEAGEKTENSLCLIAPAGESLIYYKVIFDHYIYFVSTKGQEYYSWKSDKYIREYETIAVDFYNFRTGEVEKTIDLAAIEAEHTPGKQYRSIAFIDAKVMDGKRYFKWEVCPIEDPDNYKLAEDIIYDFDADKVVDDVSFEHTKFTEEEAQYLKSIFILFDRDCNFMEINHCASELRWDEVVENGGIDISYVHSWKDGIIEAEMKVSRLPRENTKLYEEFPELKEYEGNSGETVKLFLGGYPDAEEVMEMLLEEGTEITFDGCVLYGNASIDGKKHEITSIEDYIKWCDWSKVSYDFE